MTVRIRTALLMLALSVLLPSVLAAAWLITHIDQAERQAMERGLRDSTRALSSVVGTGEPPGTGLLRLAERQPLPEGWSRSVLDDAGRLVARHPPGSAVVGQPASDALLRIVRGDREGLFQRVLIEGQPVSGYFSTSPQGWVYLTALPQAQFEGLMPGAMWRVTLGALVLMLVAVVGALLVTRGIARPVQSLMVAAQRMRAGQPVQAQHTGIAECDAVQAALAGASQTLRQAHTGLQAEVSQAVAQTRGAEQRVARRQQVEALGRLTSGVAHDVNNLLGVVSNSAHLMQRKVDDEQLHQSLAATLRAVEAGSQLTRHLLRFARRHPSRPVAVDLAVQFAQWQELMRVVLGRRIALSVSVAPGTAPVTVDPAELELSLINLALNARDALPLGGQVWLQARNAGAEEWAPLSGTGVLIALSDDGAGMDESVARHAFEPFFSTKAPGQGTGLGLSQVQAFCEQAGGHARLGSTPGLGTTVSLLLPAARPAGPVGAPWPGQRSDDQRLQGTRLLLVEDNEDLAAVTAALLASYGCQVLQARSAAQALGLVERERPDVVLSDVVMPGEMDGLDLAHRLQQRFPQLPVVLISGYSSALATGQPFTVLRKPCPPDIMVAALADAMAGAGPP